MLYLLLWLDFLNCSVARQVPLSMEFSRQEYWGGLPFPSPGDLPHPGIEPGSPALAGRFFTTEPPGKPLNNTFPGGLTGNLENYTANHFSQLLERFLQM